MCGRYQVLYDDTIDDMYDVISEINRRYHAPEMHTGEVFPTNIAPVITQQGPQPMRWGLVYQWTKAPGINVRQETAKEKPAFSGPLRNSRLVVPTTGFFEWTHAGKRAMDKFHFRLPSEDMLYLAAIYDLCVLPTGEKEHRFSILTTAANHGMRPFHDRMPVYLRKSELNAWINDEACVDEIMRRPQPEYLPVRVAPVGPQQISLF